jgi:5-keto-L-gluconate epimerase
MDLRASIATAPAKTGFGPLMYTGDVAACARVAGELGFEGIEISIKGEDELGRDELAGLLDTHGLRLAAVATGRIYLDELATLSDPDRGARDRVVKRIKAIIAYAAGFNAVAIIGLLRGQHPADGDKQGALRRFVESMKELGDYAGELEATIVVEAINRYETVLLNTAAETVEALEAIGRPSVKVLLDVFHMNIEEVSMGNAIRETGGHLGHFHVVDSNRRAPGMGHVQYEDIAKALREIGYEGWLSGEHLPLPDDYTAAKQTRAFTRAL